MENWTKKYTWLASQLFYEYEYTPRGKQVSRSSSNLYCSLLISGVVQLERKSHVFEVFGRRVPTKLEIYLDRFLEEAVYGWKAAADHKEIDEGVVSDDSDDDDADNVTGIEVEEEEDEEEEVVMIEVEAEA